MAESLERLSLYDTNFIVVASIDFGTTFSGYAFSFKNKKKEIRMNKNWGEGLGHQSFKTPTSVLTSSSSDFIAFGFEAETKYNVLLLSKKADDYQLFRHFKMILHNQKHLTRNTMIKSVCGKEGKALDIFAHALRYLKNHLLEAVSKTLESPPKPELIRWVLTVPAIWSEKSKSFMRLAALKSGLTTQISSKQLMLCLEPEASSTYCRQLETDCFAKGGEEERKLLHKIGSTYMIVDAGGGTIDIAVHKIVSEAAVNELMAVSGGDWGGIRVDENFVNLFMMLLGEEFVRRYQKECPSDWLKLLVNIEIGKRAINPDDAEGVFCIPLSWGIGSKFNEVTGGNIESVLQSTTIQGVSFTNGNILLDMTLVKSLFDPVINSIVAHIKSILTKQPAELILLNGGFGESAFLQKAIAQAFGSKIAVLCPSEASVSIIKGAVLFGYTPQVIESRIAKRTYGASVHSRFNSKKHDENRKFTHRESGTEKCKVFLPFVRKGESVRCDEVRTFVKRISLSKQTVVRKRLYCADKEIVLYCDECDVDVIGQIEVKVPDTTKGRKRRVEFKINFGATEITIKARELREDGTGDSAETTFDFLSE